MKIYANADLHGDFKQLEKIKKKVKNCDVLIFAGDMTIFGQDIDRIFSKINKLGKPTLVLHGNHEELSEVKKMAKKYEHIINLHGKDFVINNTLFIGHGGGGFSFVTKSFEKCREKFEKLAKSFNKVVFITHQPPYDTNCDRIHGEKTGSKTYRAFIRKVQPDLVITGHIHDNEGKRDKIRKSLIVNPSWQGRFLRI